MIGSSGRPATVDSDRRDSDWRYRARISDLFDYTESQRVLCAEVSAIFGDRDRIRVLDLGCGDGRRTFELLDLLGDRISTVDWLDPAPLAMRAVRERAARYDHIVHRFLAMRCQDLHTPPGNYDCVLSLHSLFVPRSELSAILVRLLSLVPGRGAVFVELPTTLSTLHRLQLGTRHRLSGRPHLEVGRSTDAIERFVAVGAELTEHRSTETVQLSFPPGVAYRDLTAEQRRLVDWFNGGDPLPPAVGEFLVGQLLAHAVPVAGRAAVTSEVSLLVVRLPAADSRPAQASVAGSCEPAGLVEPWLGTGRPADGEE